MLWGFRNVYLNPDEAGGTSAGDDVAAAIVAVGDEKDKAPKLTLEQALAKIEELDKAHKITKAEAADKRRKLEALEKAEADRKTAELSEIDKLKKQLADGAAIAAAKEAEVKALKMRQSWHKVSREAKIKWVSTQAEDDAYGLIDTEKLTYDDKGAVVGLKEALEELRKTRPYLFAVAKVEDINAGAGGDGGGKKKVDEAALIAKYGI